MKAIATTCLGIAIVLASAPASAHDPVKRDGAAKDPGTTMAMTMQQCKDHMALSEKAGMKKDSAMMKKVAMCNDLMKKDGAATNGSAVGELTKK